MKILITGFNGFVSKYFLDFLSSMPEQYTVLGLGRSAPAFDIKQYPNIDITFQVVDLLDKEKVNEMISGFEPQYLLHLASISSVGHSWKYPIESFVNNTNIFLNLIEQIRLQKIPCRILSIGSSEEYGNVTVADLPLTEDSRLAPISPYAVARTSQEMLSKIYTEGYGMDIVMTRSFNHIGPRQKDVFVISSFAKQLVMIAKGNLHSNKVVTGDLSIIRDFVDVRDVVKAYYLLLMNGRKGEVYNICSGKGISLKEIMDKMCAQLKLNIELSTDEKLIRPTDNRIIIGSSEKIKKELNWNPAIPIDTSLQDIIRYWQEKI